MAKLGDVADWGSGGTPRRSVSEYFGEGVPWLSIADLNDGVVFDAKESLTPSGIANSSAKVVPTGTLLVAMYGSIGKLGVAGREVCTSQAIAFAVPRSKVIDAQFLFHYLRAQRPALQALGRGGTQMNIGQADLKGWPIPLLPLAEQRRIAAVLDQADALRVKRGQVLAHLDSLNQSILDDMFGDPSSWPSRWPMGVIGDMTESVGYGTSVKVGETGDWPILRMGNVTDHGRLDLTDLKYIDLSPTDVPKYTVRRGDLLFNRTNSKEKVGKAAVVHTDRPLAVAGYLVRVRFSDAHRAEFVSAYLNSRHGRAVRRRLAKAAVNQANINASEMQRIPMALPPTDMQEAFSRVMAKSDAQRDAALRALAADDELFASIQSRAFRCEL